MNRVLATILFFACLDAVVWVRAHFRLRGLRHQYLWQALLALPMVLLIIFGVLLAKSRPIVLRMHHVIPTIIPSTVFVWHFLVLPLTILAVLCVMAWHVLRRLATRKRINHLPPSPGRIVSRRKFLTAAGFAVPPLASVALGAAGVGQLGEFRINRYEFAMPGWPRGLDGFTIALVADVHAGVFSSEQILQRIATATNNLRAELILLGGDLVNISQQDLPSALDMVNRLDCPNGLYMVQGNHDVIGGAEQFNSACAARGVPLLLNEARTLRPRGIPIQLLGVIWTAPGYWQHQAVLTTLGQRDPDLFPIMLAHHPHVWDLAADNGVPLVLAGHTHGGQIMLTKHIGAGPLRFRYWTGMYRRENSDARLIVSNGVGDWFPLRVNAPAEIVHITLRSAKSA